MRNESSALPARGKRRSVIQMLVLMVLCCPALVRAQVSGTISGYVQDQAGGVLPGATITVEASEQQRARTTQTNAMGFFDLQALPRGRYQIKVEMTGFETQVRKDVEVTAGA